MREMTPLAETKDAPGLLVPAGQPAEAVSRPAEVVRLAATAREALVELRSGDLGEAALNRAGAVYEQSLAQLTGLLSDGLRTELCQLVGTRRNERDAHSGHTPSAGPVPSAGELRVAEAQLAGWLDGLLQTMDASLAEQVLGSEQALEAEQREEGARSGPRPSAHDNSYL